MKKRIAETEEGGGVGRWAQDRIWKIINILICKVEHCLRIVRECEEELSVLGCQSMRANHERTKIENAWRERRFITSDGEMCVRKTRGGLGGLGGVASFPGKYADLKTATTPPSGGLGAIGDPQRSPSAERKREQVEVRKPGISGTADSSRVEITWHTWHTTRKERQCTGVLIVYVVCQLARHGTPRRGTARRGFAEMRGFGTTARAISVGTLVIEVLARVGW